jgi:hypothetical protein
VQVTDELLADDPPELANPGAYTGRVALNPDCFTDPAKFPGQCRFLDSQGAIEQLGSQNFFPSDVLVACPFVEWAGKKLP